VSSAKKSSRQIGRPRPAAKSAVLYGARGGRENIHQRTAWSVALNFTAVLDLSPAVLSAVINRNWREHDSVCTKKTDHRNHARPAGRCSNPRLYPIDSVVENAGNPTPENLLRSWPVCIVGVTTRRLTVTKNTAVLTVLMRPKDKGHSGIIGRCEENRKRKL
jgi:hypothetical protein